MPPLCRKMRPVPVNSSNPGPAAKRAGRRHACVEALPELARSGAARPPPHGSPHARWPQSSTPTVAGPIAG